MRVLVPCFSLMWAVSLLGGANAWLDGRSLPELSSREDQAIYRVAERLQDLLPTRSSVSAVRKVFQFRALALSKYKQLPVYIKGQSRLLPFDLACYKSKRCYLVLGRSDPRYRSGSYKKFSRAIDLETGSFFAHLEASVSSSRQKRSLYAELDAMERFSGDGLTLDTRDVGECHNWDLRGSHRTLSMITELFSGDLSGVSEKKYSHQALVQFALMTAKSVAVLHGKGFVHRDIKPKNFFYSRISGGTTRLVLADFGFSIPAREEAKRRGISGSRRFIAPDSCVRYVKTNFACSRSKYCFQKDIFALGMTFHDMAFSEKHKRMVQVVKDLGLGALPRRERGAERPAAFSLSKMNDLLSDYRKLQKSAVRKLQATSLELGREEEWVEFEALVLRMLSPDGDARGEIHEIIDALHAILRSYENASVSMNG